MSYTIKENKVYRNEEAIADVVGDQLDFYEGMAKYRAPAMRMFNAAKNEVEEAIEDLTDAEAKPRAPKEVKNDEGKPSWLSVLSEIVGVELDMPHPVKGWRTHIVRHKLQAKYNEIIKSDKLTDAEKRGILNQFM